MLEIKLGAIQQVSSLPDERNFPAVVELDIGDRDHCSERKGEIEMAV